MVLHQPVGPVAAFCAWNFPALNVVRKIAPAIAAGCSIILKPSEETPGSAVEVMRCFQDAGLPGNVAQMRVRRARHGLAPPARLAGHAQAELHRIGPGRQASDEARRRQRDADDDGTGRARAGAGVRRLRSGEDARHAGRAQVPQRRPGLRLADALPCAGRDLRGVRRRASPSGRASCRSATGSTPRAAWGRWPIRAAPTRSPRWSRMRAASARGCWRAAARRRGSGFFFQPTVLADVPLEAKAMNDEPFGPVALLRPFATDEDAIDRGQPPALRPGRLLLHRERPPPEHARRRRSRRG